MKILYTRPALADLDAMLTKLLAVSPQGAKAVKSRIDTIERLLCQFPMAGTRTKLSWLRRIPLTPYPYVVFYEMDDDRIIIHAIRHGARKPSSMPDANE